MTTKLTFEKLQEFDGIAAMYYSTGNNAQTKLGYAMKKVFKSSGKVFEEFKDAVDDVRVDNCLTDPDTKAILKDDKGGYMFSKDGHKKTRKDLKKLQEEWTKRDVEIETYFATEIPKDLTDEQKRVFCGVVISPDFETTKNGQPEKLETV